jgi:7-alpha-hydroxysteroid dehydrogenase
MSILDLFRLDGQVAVVTGGSKGIGRGIVLALAEAGADVVVAARSKPDVEAVAKEVRACGRRAVAFVGDLTHREQVEALAQAAVDQLGSLTIWVNNVGGVPDLTPRLLVDTPDERLDEQFDLNLRAHVIGATSAARRMQEGVIINISSMGALHPRPMFGAMTTSKAAVNHITGTLALELAPKIRVNAIGPGPIMTDQMLALLQGFAPMGTDGDSKSAPDEINEALKTPLGPGTPQDIGAATVYLASPAAKWVTGICLYVAGGWLTSS